MTTIREIVRFKYDDKLLRMKKGGTMLRKASFLLITLALLASMLVGCDDSKDNNKTETTTAKSITPIKLVPQKADMLGYIDLARISSDQDIAKIYNSMPKGEETKFPQTFEGVLAIVGKNLEQCVLFADLSSVSKSDDASSEAESNGYLGIIIKGTLDKDGLLKLIESAAGEPLTTTDYKGYQIQTDSSRELGIVFISADEAVIGTMQAVKDVLAVKAGEQSAIKGKVLDKYNELGNALFKLVAVVPAEALGESLDNSESGLPIDLSMLKDVETVSLTIDKKGQAFPLALKACFTSADSAENIKGLLGSLKGMLGSKATNVPEEYQALVSLLKDLKITLNGSCVDISIDLPVSIIEDLSKNVDPSQLPLLPNK